MTDDPHYRLTVQEAARQAGCSTKTLYRYMAAGKLSFNVGDDQRRYLSEHEIRKRFPDRQTGFPNTSLAALQHLQREVQALKNRLSAQVQRLEQALALFQPRTLKELVDKQSVLQHPKSDT